MNGLRILTLVLMLGVVLSPNGMAQERLVDKQDADRIFAFNKAQWNSYAEQIGYPEGWEIRLAPFDTGMGVGAYDPKTSSPCVPV